MDVTKGNLLRVNFTDIETFSYDLFDQGMFFITFTPKDESNIDEVISIIKEEIKFHVYTLENTLIPDNKFIDKDKIKKYKNKQQLFEWSNF